MIRALHYKLLLTRNLSNNEIKGGQFRRGLLSEEWMAQAGGLMSVPIILGLIKLFLLVIQHYAGIIIINFYQGILLTSHPLLI